MLELTIGMASYDDHEGVAYTIHSLMAHHAEVMPRCEILVVDNHPGSPSTGHIQHALGSVANAPDILGKSTYVQFPIPGTDYPKEEVMKRASGAWVLVIDSHVLLPTGVVRKVIDFIADNPDSVDLYHGPLVQDDHRSTWEEFSDAWSGKMWGQWASRPDCKDPSGPPVEIQAQGTGLWLCRKDAWVPFPRGLRGFGGAEWNMQIAWRRAERKVYCLPWLRWWHKFRDQTKPPAYPNDTIDRVINYVIWARHNELPTDRIKEHFLAENVMSAEEFDRLAENPLVYTAKRAGCGNCGSAHKQLAEVPLDDLVGLAERNAGDLNQHVPRFRELATGCDRVLEIATRPQSTVAFLAAGVQRLVSLNAAANDPMVAALPGKGKADLIVTTTSWTNYPPEPCDLFFLDERHTADAVYAQLERFGPQVTRYIVLHDTVIFGEQGEGGGPGILVAVRRWLKEHPQWSVIEHTDRQYGLTVLGCRPEDKPALPSTPRMAWNYAKAIAAHVATGRQLANTEEIERRLEVCQLCPQRTEGNRCSVCGCFIDEGPGGREGKALWAESECPLGKWATTPR